MASDTPTQIISVPDTPNGKGATNNADSHVNMQFEVQPIHAKPFPDISKIEVFSGANFKRWQERLFSTLDVHGVADVLTQSMPAKDNSPEGIKLLQQWTHANKVCRHTILSTLSNELFDVYCTKKEAKEIWSSMIAKYTAEDTVKQKFVIGNYYKWEMKEDRDIKAQIHEYQTLLEDLKSVQIELPEPFVAGILIEKLPESWRDYRRDLKHDFGLMSFNDVITHIIIEDTNRKENVKSQAKEYTSNANLVETEDKGRYGNNHSNNKPNYNKYKQTTHFKRKECYVCGKPGHIASKCRKRAFVNNKKPPKPSANLVEGDEIITVVVSQTCLVADVKEWVVDSGATRHICQDKSVFSSYTPIGDEEEYVHLGDSRTTQVHGKGKVNIKLTSGKTLSLTDVLHVPEIRTNLISVSLLGRAGVKASFESDKVVLTKNNIFIGRGYCNQGLFMLNVSEVLK
ncbi:unnamed protein product [Cuscuta epithymum]|uniref:CCHC-type domain-containing protein n=1 Tax=Cuscuta epithymum TaxID=186058 RepID=A0AAV0CLR6_9ASTE|nr:unnamed protein product [Cuscuta epithymum]